MEKQVQTQGHCAAREYLWFATSKRDGRVVGLYSRHYSAMKNKRTVPDWLKCGILGPGESMTLLTSNSDALFCWLKQQVRRDNQQGICCAVFRNESNHLSSELIVEATQLAWQRWPGERLFTYVDPTKVASTNPGFCFQMAGWKPCGKSTRGLWILETYPAVYS